MNRRITLNCRMVVAAIWMLLSSCNTPPMIATPSLAPETLEPPPTMTQSIPVPATQKLPTPESSFPVWWMITPQATRAPLQVATTSDLPYTSQDLLDVYSPETPGDWPVVIVLHGKGEAKWSMRDLATAIAATGAVVFAPSFQASPPKSADSIVLGVEQAACAVRFARAHASEYGGRDNRLMVVGYSAGGLVGALLMLAGDEFHGDCLAQQGSALPDFFIGLDGAYDPIPFLPAELLKSAPAECLKIDPFTYIGITPRREDSTFLLFVGTYPPPQQHAQAFRDALAAAGYNVTLVQIPGVDHIGMSRPLPQTVDAVASLLGL